LVLWWQYKLIDGLFLMTDELMHFYTQYTKKKCVIQKLPMTVDFSRFENVDVPHKQTPYLFYAGSLSQKKDGVESLVQAFEKISRKFPELQLWIAGGKTQMAASQQLNELILLLNLQNSVKLLGEIDRDEIPFYLLAAKILVLPRPDSIQARGGFPTKLGEYLATGRPVIATTVGEIPKYLTKSEAFLISPINIEDELLENTRAIMSNYSEALEVAKKGKTKAYQYFSTTENAKKIELLIQSITSIS
jgi:glycosyltransferase involved in cell wall biosynthesis